MESDSTKHEVYALGITKKEKRQRRTKEEKELAIQRLNKLKKKIKPFNPPLLSGVEWSEEEIEKQKQDITPNNRKKPVKQNTNTKIEKKKEIKKIISDLFCPHRKVVRKGDYMVCIRCGFKRKVSYSTGTSK